MKILGISDILIDAENIKNSFQKVFSNDEIRTLKWMLATTKEELQVIVREVEKKGPEAIDPFENLLKEVKVWDPDILITHYGPISQQIITAGKSLKFIGVLRGGVENVDTQEATKKGVVVLNTVGRTANAVAEFTIGLMLAEIKNIARGHAALKKGKWRNRFPSGDLSFELAGRTVGIVGFGQVGQAVAKKLRLGFDAHILAYDPYVSEQAMKKLNVQKCSLKELLAHSDVVTLHARLSAQTKNLIGEQELAQMQTNGYLINTARADLIDKEALFVALRDKKIRGAALDVFWDEPITYNEPFTDLDNVTLTPHYAGSTKEILCKTPTLLAEALKNFFVTGSTRAVVNREVLQKESKTSFLS